MSRRGAPARFSARSAAISAAIHAVGPGGGTNRPAGGDDPPVPPVPPAPHPWVATALPPDLPARQALAASDRMVSLISTVNDGIG